MSWEVRTSWMADCLPRLGVRLHPGMREIRLRPNQPALIVQGEGNVWLPWRPTHGEIEQTAEALCGHSLYARREEAVQGSLTLRGGHRLGVCGRRVGQRLEEISSLCLRLAGEWPGVADGLMARMGAAPGSVLVMGPPGAGKTTLLRDVCRQYSQNGVQVALLDQRGELAAMVEGVPQLDVGPCTDVMEGSSKGEGIWRLVRSMSPEVVAMDEISAEEVHLVERYACCGVHLCASVHGTDWAQMVGRMGLYPASPTGFAFDWYARLDRGAVVELLNREGQP